MCSNPVFIPWVQSVTQHILILVLPSRTAWRILLSASLRSWRLMPKSKKAPEQERHKPCYHQNSRCSNTSSWQGHIYTIIIVNYYGWLDSITNHHQSNYYPSLFFLYWADLSLRPKVLLFLISNLCLNTLSWWFLIIFVIIRRPTLVCIKLFSFSATTKSNLALYLFIKKLLYVLSWGFG